jgi:hypothetical protein
VNLNVNVNLAVSVDGVVLDAIPPFVAIGNDDNFDGYDHDLRQRLVGSWAH